MVDAGFLGPLYSIHPSAAEVLGHKAYRSLREVPRGGRSRGGARPARISSPASSTECAELAVPAVDRDHGGLRRDGRAGQGARGEAGRAACARPGGGMIGPNCAGLFSASGRVLVAGWRVPAGPIAVISQSGNMALTFAQFARDKGLGFSKLITVGNAADIRFPEYVDYLFADPETKVVVAYLEGFQGCRGPGRSSTYCGAIRRGSPSSCSSPARRRAGGGRRCPTRARWPAATAWWRPPCAECGRPAGAGRAEEAWDAAMGAGALAAARARQRGRHLRRRRSRDHRGATPPSGRGSPCPRLSPRHPRPPGRDPPGAGAGSSIPWTSLASPRRSPKSCPGCSRPTSTIPAIGGAEILSRHFGGYFKIATEEFGRRELAAARRVVEVAQRPATSR